MNDYYKVNFSITPADTDACDLLADALADSGYESFEPSECGDSLVAYVAAANFQDQSIGMAIDQVPMPVEIAWQSEFVPGQDWNSEWEKNYFKPIVVASKVVVHSSFHHDIPQAQYDIVIDPRMAFGTGHHATTTLMMQALLDINPVGLNVIDMGTGTGILAILASMLGCKNAVAIEIDPFAAENAVENVKLNLDSDNVLVIQGDASTLQQYPEYADLFLANINRNIITGDIAEYARAMKPGATIVVSGFYVQDREIVQTAAEAAGLTLKSVADIDNWSSMTFSKPCI